MKGLKKLAALLLVTAVALSACTKDKTETTTTTAADATTTTEATVSDATTTTAGSAEETTTTAAEETTTVAPATAVESKPYVYIYASELTTLNYLASNKTVNSDASSLFIDPLLLNDKFGNLVSGIAKEWSVSDDQLKWTFKLRDDVKWVKNDGTEYGKVTADDFVFAAKYVLTKENASETADMMKGFVAGAPEYYDGTSTDFATVGVKALDEYTLEYTLAAPTPFFPSLVTYSCYLPVNEKFFNEMAGKFGTDPDTILYNGEYLFKTWERDKERVYVKNDSYYMANRVHIPSFTYIKVDDSKVRFEMYKRGEVSATPVLADQIDGVLADPKFATQLYRTVPNYSTWYFQINFGSANKDFAAASKNINFRKALRSGFSRETFLTLHNPTEPTYAMRNTLNAPGLSLDDSKQDYLTYGELPAIASKDFYDEAAAKEFMAAAKTELGSTVTWPLKIIYPIAATEDGSTEGAIVKQMLEDLFAGDITVDLQTYEEAKFYEMVESKNWDMTMTGWGPDYADPSTFLDICVPGGPMDNVDMASIPEGVEYGKKVADAKKIYTTKERFQAFAEAEAYLINNALIIPVQAGGGNYAMNKIQNPYDSIKAGYGMNATKYLDLVIGDTGLTKEQRAEQKAKYESDKAAQAK